MTGEEYTSKPLDQLKYDIGDVGKQMFVQAQRYNKWEEENPWKAKAIDVGLAMIPVEGMIGAVLKRAPGMIGSFGKLYDMSRRSGGLGGWGEGAQRRIAPEYRSETKKAMMKELREHPEYDRISSKEFGGLGAVERWEKDSPTVKSVFDSWRQIIDEGGEKGPYKVTGFRGEGENRGFITSGGPGSRGPVPGRGRFHAPYPSEAANYVGYKDPQHDIQKGINTPWSEKLKRVHADELEVKKPLVVEYSQSNYEGLKDKLNLTEKDRDTLKAIHGADYDMKMERFWAKKARDAGYDAILLHDPKEEYLREHRRHMRLVTLQD